MTKYYYEGSMQWHKMDREAYTAFRSYDKQMARCYNKRQIGYKNYGGKGIEVEYSPREFVGWWLLNIKKFRGTKPTIGRLNHDGNYCFDNVIIQDRADNSREVYYRLKNAPAKAKKVISYIDGKKEYEFNSTAEASKYYGLSQQLVSMICNGKRNETRKKISFKFKEHKNEI